MSVSLLDLLSCGLAAVIILLVISLNSGHGQERDLAPAVFVEVYVHGYAPIRRDRFSFNSNGDRADINLVPDKYDPNTRRLEFPAPMDKRISGAVLMNERFTTTAVDGQTIDSGTVLIMAIPPLDRPMTLSAVLEPGIVGDAFAVSCVITDGRDPTRSASSHVAVFNEPMRLSVEYRNGVVICVDGANVADDECASVLMSLGRQ